MTLDEFADEEQRRLSAFVLHWHAGHARDPEFFPMEMGKGDWDEQFMIFEQGGEVR